MKRYFKDLIRLINISFSTGLLISSFVHTFFIYLFINLTGYANYGLKNGRWEGVDSYHNTKVSPSVSSDKVMMRSRGIFLAEYKKRPAGISEKSNIFVSEMFDTDKFLDDIINDKTASGKSGFGSQSGSIYSSDALTDENSLFNDYLKTIEEIIKANWILPDVLKERVKDKRVVLSITIKRDGEIESYHIEEASGDEIYDRASIYAIEKSKRLPPFPLAIPGKTIEIGIIFEK